MSSSTTKNLQSLCQSCGLCCDGTLFYHTPIKPTEQSGCCPSTTEEEPSIPQPCPHYEEKGRCSIYSTRPHTCNDFECDLLAALKANKTTYSESLSIIHQLKVIREKLITTLDTSSAETETLPLFIRLKQFHSGKEKLDSGFVRKNAEFYMNLVAFSHLVKRHILEDFLEEDDDDS